MASVPEVAYDYTPYGQTETATAGSGDQAAGDNPFTYTGAYELDNDDKALAHRYLSQLTHRFTQQDPSWQENNQYTYAQCDPINKSDPTGLNACNFVTLVGIVATAAGLMGFYPVSLILGIPAAAGGVICIGMWI
ncbi:RHS repeat-associated protein [Haloactinospora alba]|uniref:RHS repeat-associated protein n=1 Tax=Haloactinospora alba TaxID=405555 RepID=A0A543NNA0_9ACTN|nr:RHS repeat-associated core domain-containing protein [Haloactinospora alba]TQN33310.1 RHS repeat-associated protein [Haloactinospora alba]